MTLMKSLLIIDDNNVADGDCDYDNNNSDDADNKNYLIL